MELLLIITIFIFIIGLVVGSFLNVVILRTVSEESIVFPGSKCPKCQNPLKWYHNIPLFSYIFLRGKCAFCKEHISLQYPLVEFLTGCIFLGLFFKFCNPIDPIFGLDMMNDITSIQIINYIFALIASCLFIVIAGTDIIEMCVADMHTYSLMGTGFIYGIILTLLNPLGTEINLKYFINNPAIYSLIGLIIGFIVMEIYRYIASKLVGQEAHGSGDAYILGGIGAYIGALTGYSQTSFFPLFKYMGIIIILSVIIASLIGLPMFLKNIFKEKYALYSLIALILYSIVIRCFEEWINSSIFITVITLIIFGLLCYFFIREVLNGIKNHKSNGIPCPFGPSLVISAFVVTIIMPLS